VKLAAVAVAIVVLAAACGGKSKHASSPSTTTTARSTTTTAAKTGTQHTTSSPSTSAAGGQSQASRSPFASPGHCTILRSLAGKVSGAIPPTLKVSRTNVAAETAALKAFASSVPSELRGDFTMYVGVFSRYMRVYASIGLNPHKAPTKSQYDRVKKAAADVINTPGLAAAEQHVKHWIRVNCPKPVKR